MSQSHLPAKIVDAVSSHHQHQHPRYSMPLTNEAAKLVYWRDYEKLSWRTIAQRYRRDVGHYIRIPTLQMRYKRAKDRACEWITKDRAAILQMQTCLPVEKYEFISNNMLEHGAQQKRSAQDCAAMLAELGLANIGFDYKGPYNTFSQQMQASDPDSRSSSSQPELPDVYSYPSNINVATFASDNTRRTASTSSLPIVPNYPLYSGLHGQSYMYTQPGPCGDSNGVSNIVRERDYFLDTAYLNQTASGFHSGGVYLSNDLGVD